ncbi:MAG: hypothetical protein N2258_03135 [Brevinematales bacterium]|nr:hypothetical protein [Brevinematales bacterium]
MNRIAIFDKYFNKYDEWFKISRDIFLSELNVIKSLIPENSRAIEIGVGSDIFAESFGIKMGVKPSENIGKMVRRNWLDLYLFDSY